MTEPACTKADILKAIRALGVDTPLDSAVGKILRLDLFDILMSHQLALARLGRQGYSGCGRVPAAAGLGGPPICVPSIEEEEGDESEEGNAPPLEDYTSDEYEEVAELQMEPAPMAAPAQAAAAHWWKY